MGQPGTRMPRPTMAAALPSHSTKDLLAPGEVENENPFASGGSGGPPKMAPVQPPAPVKKLGGNPFEQNIAAQKDLDAELERKRAELKRKAEIAA